MEVAAQLRRLRPPKSNLAGIALGEKQIALEFIGADCRHDAVA
jgi:hypothetical protein